MYLWLWIYTASKDTASRNQRGSSWSLSVWNFMIWALQYLRSLWIGHCSPSWAWAGRFPASTCKRDSISLHRIRLSSHFWHCWGWQLCLIDPCPNMWKSRLWRIIWNFRLCTLSSAFSNPNNFLNLFESMGSRTTLPRKTCKWCFQRPALPFFHQKCYYNTSSSLFSAPERPYTSI